MTEQEKGVSYICHHLNNYLAISLGSIKVIKSECDCYDIKKQARKLQIYCDYLVRTTRYINRVNISWDDMKKILKDILIKFKIYVNECIKTIENLVSLKFKDRMETIIRGYDRVVTFIETIDEVDLTNWKYI